MNCGCPPDSLRNPDGIIRDFARSLSGVLRYGLQEPWKIMGGYGTTPVGWGGGNRYVEGDLLTFGYLMLNDSLGYPYYRLINVG